MESKEPNCDLPPLAELIKQYGYPIEIHKNIETEDGYLVTAYRIPYGKVNKDSSPKPVVLLLHGLATNGADFTIPGPKRALAFALSDQGYDVWMATTRGKTDARKHVKYNPDTDEQFWKFSFHEFGACDLPAFINHIKKVTGLKTLALIGHSMGSILPFILFSEKPEYNESISLVIALNPPLIVPNLKSIPYKLLNISRYVWLTAMEKTGKLEFPPRRLKNFCSSLLSRIGESNRWVLIIATQVLYLIHGRTPQQFVQDDVPLMLKFYPDSTSAIVIKHLGQTYRTGLFSKFDYGLKGNLEKYGTLKPPLYDLSKALCPVALFCSSGDIVVQPKDVRVMYRQLPNCVALHEIEEPKFNHSDFLYGKHAVDVIFPHIFKHLSEYCKAK